jgi:hypothetical protein
MKVFNKISCRMMHQSTASLPLLFLPLSPVDGLSLVAKWTGIYKGLNLAGILSFNSLKYIKHLS